MLGKLSTTLWRWNRPRRADEHAPLFSASLFRSDFCLLYAQARRGGDPGLSALASKLRPGFLLATSVLVCACASNRTQAPDPTLSDMAIEAIVIRNELAYGVTDVQILAVNTGRFAACGNLMAGTACRTDFETTALYAGKAVVTWKERGQPQTTGEFVIEAPEDFDPARPAWLEVIIFAPGDAGARIEQ